MTGKGYISLERIKCIPWKRETIKKNHQKNQTIEIKMDYSYLCDCLHNTRDFVSEIQHIKEI